MDNMKHFDGPNFEADVLNASEPVVVDFYADWCGPCRMMTPVVEQLAGEYAGKVTIGKLDVDVNHWSTAWSDIPAERPRSRPGSRRMPLRRSRSTYPK